MFSSPRSLGVGRLRLRFRAHVKINALQCSVRGRAVVDGSLSQLGVINREESAGALMQVPGIIWVNNRKPLCQHMPVPEYSGSR